MAQSPAVQSLARRLEHGGVLSGGGIGVGICQAAQPFFAVLLQKIFPRRPLVIVAPDLKTQESFQQDIETWLQIESKIQSAQLKDNNFKIASPNCQLQFYPAWEVLPHEGKLPHADIISDRLQTLVGLSTLSPQRSTLIVTSVTALLQKTYPPGEIQNRTRILQRGDKINPLDLIEWLEEQGYEPEAQVTKRGEIALRGGILDIWPLTSPWPVRLEFFGDELESLRHFDPLTQISRGEITEATITPGGELGILKSKIRSSEPETIGLAILPDHLPPQAIFLLCEPEQLAAHANDYETQIPANDPFFITWNEFFSELKRRGFTSVELIEEADTSGANLEFRSLDAFRPLAQRAPELQIAEAQRREF
ncbi:MAG TPA: hypothetical protein VMA13_01420, partial [Candidatus Saccharimonadales bacterium]|nr:hypothetical protein [Candidatus Saccharimonadales bacterium]